MARKELIGNKTSCLDFMGFNTYDAVSEDCSPALQVYEILDKKKSHY